MSRVSSVLKNKNRLERIAKTRRRDELNALKTSAAFRARLKVELEKVDILLNSGEIEEVVIEIPNNFLANFGEAIYSTDLMEYNVRQKEGEPNQFIIGHKYIQF